MTSAAHVASLVLPACSVCWEAFSPTGSQFPLCCEDHHAICDVCLSNHVRDRVSPPQRLVASGGGIPCATFGCASRPWALEDLTERLDKGTAVAFGIALRRIFLDAPAAVAAAAAASAKRDAEARTLSIPARAREIASIIAERDLWLRCPRCSAKYLDYTGCCALTCAANGCTFCGICLSLHPTDAATHAHFHAAHGGDIFDAARVRATHRERRTGLVVAAVRSYVADGRDLQHAVICELAREEPVPGFCVDAALLTCSAGVGADADQGDPIALAAAAAAALLGVQLLRTIADNCVFEAVRLVSDGADLSVSDAGGAGALLRALEKPLPDVIQAIVTALTTSKCSEALDKCGRTALHIAAGRGLSSTITILLVKGVSIDAFDDYGETALHTAVSLEYEDVALQLVAAGANASVQDNSGTTAFVLALEQLRPAVALAIISALPASRCGRIDEAGDRTALHMAVATGASSVVAALLAKRVDIDAVDGSGATALHAAVSLRHDDVALLLVAAGANAFVPDNSGSTAFVRALKVPRPAIALAIIEASPASQCGRVDEVRGCTALHLAVATGASGVVAALLAKRVNIDAVDCNGTTALHAAVLLRNEELALELIAAGAKALVRDGSGWNAFVLALEIPLTAVTLAIISALPASECGHIDETEGYTALHIAVVAGASGVVAALLAKSVSVNAVDERGRTPLVCAVNLGMEVEALQLIAAGADLQLLDNEGCSVLLLTCREGLSAVALAMLTTPTGIDVNHSSTEYGETALHWASRNCSPSVVAALLDKTAHLNALNRFGLTPLGIACEHGREDNALLLIGAGADVHPRDAEGSTALLIACRMGMSDAVLAMLAAPSEANVNSSNKEGDTALHWASSKCTRSVVTVLLEKKAQIDAQNKWGWGPLGYACQKRRQDIALLLIAAGADAYRAAPSHLLDMRELWGMPDVRAALLPSVALGAELLDAISTRRSLDAIRLIRNGASLCSTSELGMRRSALVLSCKHSLPGVALAILEVAASRRVDVNAADNQGMTPLSWASKYALRAVVGALLARGADVDAIDTANAAASLGGTTESHGTTALWHACINGHEDIALQLLATGASVSLGRSCLLACGSRLSRVKACIRRVGAAGGGGDRCAATPPWLSKGK